MTVRSAPAANRGSRRQDATQNKIVDVQARIEKQRRMIEGFQTLRNATPNQDVIRQADSNIRNAQHTISFLEDSLQSLQSRAAVDVGGGVGQDAALARPGGAVGPVGQPVLFPGTTSASDERRSNGEPVHAIDTRAAYRGSFTAYAQNASHPGAHNSDASGGMSRHATATPRHYTNLDLIKYDMPLTNAKIARMLNQLEFKLQLEKQYKQGFDKIARLYEAEGDRRSHADAERRRWESASKMVLIQHALKRYKQLDVMADTAPPDDVPYGARRAHRKPQTGTLSIAIVGAKDIDHSPVSSAARATRDSSVGLRIEDTERAHTHFSRTDHWNENVELPVDNACEIELIVYDRVGSAHPIPVGLLWIRICDLVEQLRKKKFGQVGSASDASPHLASSGQGEWVTADRMEQEPRAGSAAGTDAFYSTPAGQLVPTSPVQSGVEDWFSLEPTGAIFLRLNFVKQNVQKRPYDARLGRQGALRKRREDVSEVNGHQFVPRQFYQMIRCALCGELLLNAAGSQCQECNYTCHRKCAQKVVTKCISMSRQEAERDEVKINHRIPHRFEPFTNLGANWCCHCGYMLALGRRTNRKCIECDITCHADCVHLVPDFCGMSMEMANQLLSNIATINKDRRSSRSALDVSPQKSATDAPRPPISPAPPPRAAEGRTAPSESPGVRLAQGMQAVDLAHDGPKTLVPQPGAPVAPLLQAPAPATPPSMLAADGFSQQSRPPRPLPQPAQAPGPGAATTSPPSSGVSPRQAPLQQAPVPVPRDAMPPRIPAKMDMAAPDASSALAPPMQPAATTSPGLVPSPNKVVAQATAPPATTPQALQTTAPQKVTLNDFNFLAVLGKGNFGKVMLAEEKSSGQLFAIKVLKKEFIIENDEIDSTRSEKRVFLTAAKERHPFLLGLHSCFQTETRVYFVMEYVSGGDLMLHIQREQFNLHRARFYAAEVLLALEYFHKHGIIYRDLKLDNIMLTLDGHVKIADYGLCKEGMWHGNTTSTFCGTPEFMAPEILLEQRYGRAVDWWAFGILLYEMLLGQAPFRGDDEEEIFDAILEDEPLYPIQMPRESVSLLQQLLTRDPARRLGAGKRDADEIKAHPFFRDVDWDDLLHKRATPPFCPTLKNASDTTWFDTEFTREKPTLTPVHSVFSAQDQAEFRSFSWTNPHVA
ncbi:protein kinase C [Malassezia sp. CBS 17886]|nr:protein kinase C [Malassezia sp. CBS 17886]